MKNWVTKLKGFYKRVDARAGGRLAPFVQTFKHFVNLRGAEAAAGMAYYALFSIFPLTLLLISLLGTILGSEAAYQQALRFIMALFPFSGDLINTSLREVVEQRRAIGVLGLIGLIWSATGFFDILGRAVNRAWPSVKLRGFVQNRLVAFGMVGGLFLLLLLSLVSSTVVSLLPSLARVFGFQDWIIELSLWRSVLRLISPLFTFLLFTALYRWVPNKDVRWRAVLIGALFVTVVWELGKSLFAYYLGSGFARYEVIYGSLSTLIALMVWIYFSSLLALLGAHLVAALDIRGDQIAAQAERQVEAESPEPDRLQGAGSSPPQPEAAARQGPARALPPHAQGRRASDPSADKSPVKGVRG